MRYGATRAVSVGDQNHSFLNLGWETLNVFPPADHLARIGQDPLPFGDGEIDFMNTSHVLEHLRTPQLRRFLKEARRVLAPWGVLRICVPNLELFLRSYHQDSLALHYERLVTKRLTMRQSLEVEIKAGRYPPEVLEPHNGLISVVASYTDGRPPPLATREEVDSRLRGDLDGFVEWCVSLKRDAEEDYGHFNAFTFDRMERFLVDAGFSSVRRSAFRQDCAHPLLRKIDRPNKRHISLYVQARPA
jgi:SAM-dependent methyltransferase